MNKMHVTCKVAVLNRGQWKRICEYCHKLHTEISNWA